MAGYAETVAYWQSFPIKTVSDLEQRLDNFRVLFAYHSGKIENEEITLHDTREIFENGKVENGERPGEYKKHDYITGRNEVGAPADRVAEDMADLLEEVSEYHGTDVIRAGAYFHAVFENIHPFSDGNGRTGRTLLNYYLMTHNHPPLIVYDQDKRLYYECLEKYDAEETIAPLTEFLKYETEKTWEKTLERGERENRKKRLEEIR